MREVMIAAVTPSATVPGQSTPTMASVEATASSAGARRFRGTGWDDGVGSWMGGDDLGGIGDVGFKAKTLT